jgi:pimeloyl-ACP methyl ester carboxylesterase
MTIVFLAGLISVNAQAQSSNVSNVSQSSHPNVVLVHGAWADGSSWSNVIPLLQENGYNVTAVQIPLTSLADDAAVTQRVSYSIHRAASR